MTQQAPGLGMALGVGSQRTPLSNSEQGTVKVKVAGLVLGNILSLTQIHQVGHLRGTLNYLSFQHL